MTITHERLAELRDKATRGMSETSLSFTVRFSPEDIIELLDEIERLQANVDGLTTAHYAAIKRVCHVSAERDLARATLNAITTVYSVNGCHDIAKAALKGNQ